MYGSSPSAAVIQKVAAHTAREHASVVCSTLGSQVSRYRRSLAILENVMLIIVVAAPSLNVAARCAAPRMGFAPSPKELSNDPTIKETLAAAAVERAEREARARNIKSEALPFMVSFIDFRKSTARVQSPPVSDHLRGQSRYRSPTTILCERVRVRTGAPARPRRLDAR